LFIIAGEAQLFIQVAKIFLNIKTEELNKDFQPMKDIYCFEKGLKYMLLISIIFLTSCITQKNRVYLQNKVSMTEEFVEPRFEDYRLKPNDELYIQISSLDEASANIFSSTSAQSSLNISGMQPYGASLAAYGIDKEGYLLLPIIGKIYANDKTVSEVSDMLKDSLTSILNQPIVSVKLVNRYVSVLGEVRNPGHFAYAQDKLTIFNALGLAGDVTEYGDRSEVVLTRNENGKILKICINLTQSNIISSQYYYLRPNDLIYVKPLKKKFWGMKEFPFTIILSTISTALLIYSVVIK
jgi:polysaccharide biosynthesis/export protein